MILDLWPLIPQRCSQERVLLLLSSSSNALCLPFLLPLPQGRAGLPMAASTTAGNLSERDAYPLVINARAKACDHLDKFARGEACDYLDPVRA